MSDKHLLHEGRRAEFGGNVLSRCIPSVCSLHIFEGSLVPEKHHLWPLVPWSFSARAHAQGASCTTAQANSPSEIPRNAPHPTRGRASMARFWGTRASHRNCLSGGTTQRQTVGYSPWSKIPGSHYGPDAVVLLHSLIYSFPRVCDSPSIGRERLRPRERK